MNTLRLKIPHRLKVPKDKESIPPVEFKEVGGFVVVECDGASNGYPLLTNESCLDVLLQKTKVGDYNGGPALLELESDEVVSGDTVCFWKDMTVFRNYVNSESKWRASGYTVGPKTSRRLNTISSNLSKFFTAGSISFEDEEATIESVIQLPIVAPKASSKATEKLITAIKSGLLTTDEALVAGIRSDDRDLVEFLVKHVGGDASKCGVEYQNNGIVARFHKMKGNKNLLGLFTPSRNLLLYLATYGLADGVAFQEAQGIPWAKLPTKLSYDNDGTHKGVKKLGLYLTPPKLEIKGLPLPDGVGKGLTNIAARESACFSYITPVVKAILESGADIEYGLDSYSDAGRAWGLKKAVLELPETAGKYFTTPLAEIKAGILAKDAVLGSIVAKAALDVAPAVDGQEIDLF